MIPVPVQTGLGPVRSGFGPVHSPSCGSVCFENMATLLIRGKV